MVKKMSYRAEKPFIGGKTTKKALLTGFWQRKLYILSSYYISFSVSKRLGKVGKIVFHTLFLLFRAKEALKTVFRHVGKISCTIYILRRGVVGE